MNFGAMKTRLRAAFDITDQEAADRINLRYVRMVAEARYLVNEVEIAVTVADQGSYALDDSIVDLEALYTDGTDGVAEYERIGRTDLFGLKSGRLSLRSGLVFAPDFPASGSGGQVELYPEPDSSGLSIVALAAVQPAELTDDADEFVVPADLHEFLYDGAHAQSLALDDERLAEADRYETRFEEGIKKLRQRRYSRIGSGPVAISVGRRPV